MKKAIAFFQLIRWPNLLFIAITQILFYFIVIPFCYNQVGSGESKISDDVFLIILGASLLIGAGGYIINDYFDINIDQVNKADKMIIGKYINRRSAILLHATFSFVGLLLSIDASAKLHNWYIALFNLIAILLLLFYSTTFKKKLLIGNIIIGLLTAWTIFVLTVADIRFHQLSNPAWSKVLKLSILYGGFAFIISIIREVIKDMEDVGGDRKFGCTTMPIVWGIHVSKVYTAVWIIVLCGSVAALITYFLFIKWWLIFIYGIIAVIMPLIYVIRKLYRAKNASDFHQLSSMIKFIMLAGILSMIFLIQ